MTNPPVDTEPPLRLRKHLEHIHLKLGVENRASAIRVVPESDS